MRNKITVHRKYDAEIIDSIICDICKKTYKGENWEREHYDVLETQVKLHTGNSFPEGGSGKDTFFDICPTCFIEKLIPALKQLGAEPTTEEWDW